MNIISLLKYLIAAETVHQKNVENGKSKCLEKLHKHKCDHCAYIWEHDSSHKGNRSAHECPQCKHVQWTKYKATRTELKNEIPTVLIILPLCF